MQKHNQLAVRSKDEGSETIVLAEPIDDYYNSAYFRGAPETTERQQLLAVLGILRKNWLLITLITFVGTAAVVFYVAQQPDYYTASVRVQVNNETNPAVGGDSTSSVILRSGNDPAYFGTQLQILEGRGLIRRVVVAMGFDEDPSILRPGNGEENGAWHNVLRMFGLASPPEPAQTRLQPKDSGENADLVVNPEVDSESESPKLAPYVSLIKNGLNVYPVKDNRIASQETRLIQVDFTHSHPEVAARVVNALADTYVIQNLEQKVQTNASASKFLQKRVAELQSEIRQGEVNLINYSRQNQILSLDSSQNTVVQRLADLNSKLSQAEIERINAEAALLAARQNPLSGVTAESRDARTTALEGQLSALRQQLAQLKVEYTDEWPAVREVQKQIAGIESELQSSRRRSAAIRVSELEQNFREASSKENELRRNFEAQRKAVLDQNQAAINYRIIEQEIATNKELLDNLLQKTRETEVILNGTPNNVNVVDRALPPSSPQGPNRARAVLIAFLASLTAGVGLAFLRNWLDDTVRASDNFELKDGIPVLGMVPGVTWSLGNGYVAQLLEGRRTTARNGQAYSPENFSKPVVAEAFHQVRTSLMLSSPGGPPKTILVTSGQPLEGKTISSLNLARSMAELRNRVLLIDADLRCPKMHLINELGNSAGLSTLLTTDNLNAKQIEDTICKDVGEFLDILPSGPMVPNPANLLGSDEMGMLMDVLESRYSHIIIDSPPVLYFADSVILAASVDAVVLVSRANYSSHEVHSRAKKRIEDVHGNVIGIILNDVPLRDYKYHNSVYYRQLDAYEGGESTNGTISLK